MICPICGRDTKHNADAQVVKCRHCLRSFQLEPKMNTESQQQIAQEAREEWFSHYKCVGDRTEANQILDKIILSAIERATAQAEREGFKRSEPPLRDRPHAEHDVHPRPRRSDDEVYNERARSTPREARSPFSQRSEQQEWTPEYVKHLSESTTRAGYYPIAKAHNAALTAERTKLDNTCKWYQEQLTAERQRREQAESKAGEYLIAGDIVNRDNDKLRAQLLSALAAIEKHNEDQRRNMLGEFIDDVDLSLLHERETKARNEGWTEGREHQRKCDAELRKPLVDALERIARQLPSEGALIAIDALAKVKQ